ncbi:TPR-like protein [Agrocybe pediades]|nr:TPR-like protein [Agrocybe pediades]
MSTEEGYATTSEDTESEQINLDIANERKAQGNELFRAGKWNEALVAYQAALNCVPKRPQPKGKERSPDDNPSIDRTEEAASVTQQEEVAPIDVSSPGVSEDEKKLTNLRAVLSANIGACHVKLGEYKEAVKACSEAILDDPDYIKARERRASCNEILGTWTSYTAAQEDYNALLKLYTSPAQINDVQKKLRILKPKLEAAQKRETDEMLSKLKGLGDSILGNFGLSTNNFKFEPNGQGGYSVNFTR